MHAHISIKIINYLVTCKLQCQKYRIQHRIADISTMTLMLSLSLRGFPPGGTVQRYECCLFMELNGGRPLSEQLWFWMWISYLFTLLMIQKILIQRLLSLEPSRPTTGWIMTCSRFWAKNSGNRKDNAKVQDWNNTHSCKLCKLFFFNDYHFTLMLMTPWQKWSMFK